MCKMGFIGVGNRGSRLLNLFMTNADADIAALCDVYEPYVLRDRSKVYPRYLAELEERIPKMGEKFSTAPQQYADFRKLLDNKDIDAVCIATPDHWHATQTIMALHAKRYLCRKTFNSSPAGRRGNGKCCCKNQTGSCCRS